MDVKNYECPEYTYKNKSGVLVYNVCEQPLKNKKIETEYLVCPKCTFKNNSGVSKCSICYYSFLKKNDLSVLLELLTKPKIQGIITDDLAKQISGIVFMKLGYLSGTIRFSVKHFNGGFFKYGKKGNYPDCEIALECKNGKYCHFVLNKTIEHKTYPIDLGQYSGKPIENRLIPKEIYKIYKEIIGSLTPGKNIGNCCLFLTMCIGTIWIIKDYEKELKVKYG